MKFLAILSRDVLPINPAKSDRIRRLRAAVKAVGLEPLETRRLFAVLTVNTTADTDVRDSSLTLREAINVVNGTDAFSSLSAQEKSQINTATPLGTSDTIDFNIAGSGVQIISLTSALPSVSKPVTIDGYSQPGASANTLAVGDNANIVIQIDATHAPNNDGGSPSSVNALTLDTGSGGSVVRGLSVMGFNNHGIQVYNNSGSIVAGNFIGVLPNGQAAPIPTINNGGVIIGFQTTGVYVNATTATVGGTSPADRNIISGNTEGLELAGDSIVVEGNYIGTSLAGTAAIPNFRDGVRLDFGKNDVIGGTTAAARNLISGNGEDGLGLNSFDGESFTNTVIEGNYIGVDVTGNTALPNGYNGIDVDSSDRFFASDTVLTIGGAAPGAGNVISGNKLNGIEISGDHGSGNVVEGNFIGTDSTGKIALANMNNGVMIEEGASNNTIGGTAAGARNVISGNHFSGVEVDGYSQETAPRLDNNASNNVIEGNYIGTDVTGSIALANSTGVTIRDGSQNNTIGGTTARTRNVISGNEELGINLEGTGDETVETTANVVEGNYIGTDLTGEFALGDGAAGVNLTRGAAHNTIGGTTAGARNLISGIAGAGIFIEGNGGSGGSGGTGTPDLTQHNTIEGNYIGTDATGAALVTFPPPASTSGGAVSALDGQGIYLDSESHDNIIGGTTAAARNVISGNKRYGVYISGASNNVVEGDYIGVDVNGVKALANTAGGVLIDDASTNNLIGGTSAGARNVISGNSGDGIEIKGTDGDFIPNTVENDVEGNYIGVDATGAKALGNALDGVFIDENAGNSAIGGVGAGNVISGNGFGAGNNALEYGDGVELRGASPGGETFDSVVGNFIGTDATGTLAIGNAGDGVHVFNRVYNIQIGGTVAAAGNMIAYNGRAGVDADASSNIPIRFNTIFANKGLGIDLGGDGPTPNSRGGVQNTPVLVNASATASSVTISGTYNGFTNQSYVLDFYADSTVSAAGFAQGRQRLGSIAVTTDANGNATFNATFDAAVGSNKYITAIATNESTSPFGDTSEFTPPVEATATTPVTPPVAPSIFINDVRQNEGNTGTTAYTFTLTRTGDLSLASTVAVSTANGTATAGSDYTAVSQQVTFLANQATATVTVHVTGDKVVEPDETFLVKLTAVTNATLGTAQGLGTIVNDDATTTPTANGALTGYTFNDANGDGLLDNGETNTSGKTVFLDTNNNGKLDTGEKTVVSDTVGNFAFAGLAAGTYHVRRVFPSGYTASTPLIDVTITASQTLSNLKIGSKTTTTPPPTTTATISGFTFDDANKDGVYQATEARTSSKVVFLDTNNNGKLDAGEKSVVTTANGVFSFTGLAAGTYHVRRVFPTGYTYSTKLIDLVLTAGQATANVLIGSKVK